MKDKSVCIPKGQSESYGKTQAFGKTLRSLASEPPVLKALGCRAAHSEGTLASEPPVLKPLGFRTARSENIRFI